MSVTQTEKSKGQTEHKFAGCHFLASYLDCHLESILDTDNCLLALRQAAVESGVTIVGENVHRFPNGGITAVLLLAESHASLHTYPEHNSCFVDFFTCGKGDIEKFDAKLRCFLKPARAVVELLQRGDVEHTRI